VKHECSTNFYISGKVDSVSIPSADWFQRRRSGEIGIRSRLKIFGKRRFNNFQDLPKSTENIVQTHDWRGFFANVPSENG